jgi:hypothetical protein
MTKLTTDFKIDHNENRGIYYEETKRCIIYAPMHETIEDLLKTIDHEVYHHCFTVLEETEDMDEDQEERLIFNLQWAEIAC